MLNKYKPLIYESVEDEICLKNKCIELILNDVNLAKKQVLEQLHTASEIGYNYVFYKNMLEGELLFNKAVEKFGITLWSGNAWKNKTCRSKCPVGDVCKKDYITIDNDKYCYGQLFLDKTDLNLLEISKSKKVLLCKSDGTVRIKISPELIDDINFQIVDAFFSSYQFFIMSFGDFGHSNYKRKVNGHNVLSYMMK